MDEIVRQAMTRWPDVPACHGWLRLDRRGQWHVPDGPLRHPGLVDFIQRNYSALPDGLWFFQNGPQRVFVDLDYTPLILRLAGDGRGHDRLHTHTGQTVPTLTGAWLDEEGSLLLGWPGGAGLVDDRDLGRLADQLCDTPQGWILDWQGQQLLVGTMKKAEVPAHFGFIARPRD